jgi:glycosyltransferase involved in cell wall biosynthesis
VVAICLPPLLEEEFESKGVPPRLFLAANLLSMNGGSRSVLEDLTEHLRSAGYSVVAASPYRNGLIRGVHMLKTAMLMRRKYDLAVVDLYSGRAFLIAEALSVLLNALGCPFVLVLRGGALPDFARRQPKRVKACLRRATMTVAPSRYLLEEMRPFNDKLRLLPNPVNLAACELRRRQQPQPKLVWLRAFHETYNPTLAPRVLKLLAENFPDVQLTMVGRDKGDGSLARTKQVAGALGVSDRITMVGGVRKGEVTSWLNQGDIFLNTTSVDNTPVSVLEAMACGLCMVSTNVGGIPYLLDHEQDALLVEPDDEAAMAAAISRILTEPGLGERLSRNARLKAEQFDWSIIMLQWQSLFATLAESANGRSA